MNDFEEHFTALCQIAGIDPQVATPARLTDARQKAARLAQAGYTIADLRAFDRYWSVELGRTPPTLNQVMDHIGQLRHAKPDTDRRKYITGRYSEHIEH